MPTEKKFTAIGPNSACHCAKVCAACRGSSVVNHCNVKPLRVTQLPLPGYAGVMGYKVSTPATRLVILDLGAMATPCLSMKQTQAIAVISSTRRIGKGMRATFTIWPANDPSRTSWRAPGPAGFPAGLVGRKLGCARTSRRRKPTLPVVRVYNHSLWDIQRVAVGRRVVARRRIGDAGRRRYRRRVRQRAGRRGRDRAARRVGHAAACRQVHRVVDVAAARRRAGAATGTDAGPGTGERSREGVGHGGAGRIARAGVARGDACR